MIHYLPAASVITFREFTSPEVLEKLNLLREKVILPSYLSTEEQRRLYKQKYEQQLAKDPFVLHLAGNKKIEFRYQDRFQLPNHKETVRDILKSMKGRKDLLNIPALLEGLYSKHRAGRVPEDVLYTRVVRKLGKHKSLDMIMELVRKGTRTGFVLERAEVISEILTYIQKKAIDKQFEEEATQEALKLASEVLTVLEDSRYHDSKTRRINEKQRDKAFHMDPQFLAARLHLSASLVHDKDVKAKGMSNATRNTIKYAQDLLVEWPDANKGLLTLQKPPRYAKGDDSHYLTSPSQFLWHASPIARGLAKAAEVAEPTHPELAKELLARAETIRKELREQRKKLTVPESTERPLRGVELYETLFPEEKVRDAVSA